MKTRVFLIAPVILIIIFRCARVTPDPDIEMQLIRQYNQGYSDGYLQRQRDYELQIQIMEKRANYFFKQWHNEVTKSQQNGNLERN